MFSTYSMTGTGVAITLILALFRFLGVEADDGAVTAMVEAVAQFAGAAFIVWGQLRRTDLKYGLIRK